MNLNWVLCLFGIVIVVPIFAEDLSSPIIKLFEVDEYNKVIRPYERVNKRRSEIITEDIKQLRLECYANYPVQWIYTGNGIPIMSTDVSVWKTLSTFEGKNDENGYVASVFLGPLREHHTGKYQCSRTDYVTVTPSVYVFVPGQDLFLDTQGKTIRIHENVTSTSLPCTVSNPNVQVSLYRLNGNLLVPPKVTAEGAISYDPRKGFRINLKKLEDPEGLYICSGRYKDLVVDVEYTVTSQALQETAAPATPEPPPPSPPDNYEEFKQRAEETCKGESCRQCDTHTDCPPAMNCYTDHMCRDPCTYSINCGTSSKCRVVDFRPQCYCPPGFVGDATKECLSISRERLTENP
ncbi:hypothetical protein Bhyg_13361 [Pseudolycoriella hygida]|uniref:EGF-like domain-containing protein n=1 Tax=Pseudolycoriella hygida TaxID=35572 RepID=A0A9Q0RWA9_9DIPT|nr:hypothetical protein Bhyg_13361 [Pseudolycoriella hygida]